MTNEEIIAALWEAYSAGKDVENAFPPYSETGLEQLRIDFDEWVRGKYPQLIIPSVIGETLTSPIDEATVTWLRKDGAKVEADEVVCELDTDKATYDIASTQAGILGHVAEDKSSVNTGDILAYIV